MEMRRLGRNGLEVPALCLGTMTFGFQADEPHSVEILDAAFERGLTFLDTADAYPLGGSLDTVGATEAIIGRWMKARGNRDRIILATKCFAPMRRGPNASGLSRQHIIESIDATLKRLQTDYVDLYQAHAFDPRVPIEESLRAFDDLIRAGKVRYVGCSNYPAWRLGQALAAADRLELARYASLQPRYNLLYREIETELLPLARAEGLGVLVYNPLAGGMLSGKYRRDQGPQPDTRFTLGSAGGMYQGRYWHDAYFDAVESLGALLRERGASLPSVAVSWVLRQSGITSAIIGVSRVDQLDANVAAPGVAWDDALDKACDALWWQLPRRPVTEGYR
jgi:aryl-alcohol dehydrogenase-like predicted oxidoreductase